MQCTLIAKLPISYHVEQIISAYRLFHSILCKLTCTSLQFCASRNIFFLDLHLYCIMNSDILRYLPPWSIFLHESQDYQKNKFFRNIVFVFI